MHNHRKATVRKSRAGVYKSCNRRSPFDSGKERGLTSNYFVVAALCSNRVTQHIVTDAHIGKTSKDIKIEE